MIHFPAIAQF